MAVSRQQAGGFPEEHRDFVAAVLRALGQRQFLGGQPALQLHEQAAAS